jgi:hypothetical protein
MRGTTLVRHIFDALLFINAEDGSSFGASTPRYVHLI